MIIEKKIVIFMSMRTSYAPEDNMTPHSALLSIHSRTTLTYRRTGKLVQPGLGHGERGGQVAARSP
jgi:hypothetical protein